MIGRIGWNFKLDSWLEYHGVTVCAVVSFSNRLVIL